MSTWEVPLGMPAPLVRAPDETRDGSLGPFRLVSIGLFVSLIWKLQTYRWLLVVYQNVPIRDQFFPGWLQSNLVLAVAYALACGLAVWGVVGCDRRLLRWQTSGLCLALATLCLHQGSYNDVTFCTAFWTSVWGWWYVRRVDRDAPAVLHDKAAFLAHSILAVILLGGAVGKMTSGYWDGAVLYDIYFADRNYWTFNVLRSWFDPAELRSIATWYSRFVILTELLGPIALVILPRRAASLVGMVILFGIALLSNLQLFSVLTCLLSLLAIGLWWPRYSPSASRC